MGSTLGGSCPGQEGSSVPAAVGELMALAGPRGTAACH